MRVICDDPHLYRLLFVLTLWGFPNLDFFGGSLQHGGAPIAWDKQRLILQETELRAEQHGARMIILELGV